MKTAHTTPSLVGAQAGEQGDWRILQSEFGGFYYESPNGEGSEDYSTRRQAERACTRARRAHDAALRQQQIADSTLAGFDFGFVVSETGRWQDQDTRHWFCTVTGEDDEGRRAAVLHVVFPKRKRDAMSVYALDLRTGNDIGHAATPAER